MHPDEALYWYELDLERDYKAQQAGFNSWEEYLQDIEDTKANDAIEKAKIKRMEDEDQKIDRSRN